ncbi:hypothetical protein POKO110462_12530 [Pontibacter korlensis]
MRKNAKKKQNVRINRHLRQQEKSVECDLKSDCSYCRHIEMVVSVSLNCF